jgi:hypothetical protein
MNRNGALLIKKIGCSLQPDILNRPLRPSILHTPNPPRRIQMNVLETILSASGGDIVKQLAGQFGITPDQATSVSVLLPPLAAAGGKLTDVVGQLASVGHSGILDTVKGLTAKMFG